MRTAFRQEIGAVVRSASPFVIAILAAEGRTLDDVVTLIEPLPAWPRRPRLSGGGLTGGRMQQHYLRQYVAGLRLQGMSEPPFHGHEIDLAGGGWLKVQIADHSVELHGRVGRAFLTTRFGELRVKLIDEIPHSLLLACVGRPIESVVDHAALRDRGWWIAAVEDGTPADVGQVLVVPTGSVAYRMPWMR